MVNTKYIILEWSVILSLSHVLHYRAFSLGLNWVLYIPLCVLESLAAICMNRGSKMYAYFIDASKAFDLVNHCMYAV